ncbi:PLP-dependent transferase [Sulfidibacter corallicola]|uniref:PLP-dependent transferase n=1 Tax=Sulfidibacter corallicola TaxID=2818388 RepID=A0A8A4TSE0_SULCO|nr:PLP-dependent aspartate aminotransferase family protein [Sulfidibacter corallicola]QTD49465.1 PLP-dependent transferase [Sulfidibacter corallicola]
MTRDSQRPPAGGDFERCRVSEPISGFSTRAIHEGCGYRDQTGAVTPPIYATSTFEYGNEGGFDYTRSGNPNFRNLEATLRSLEHAAHATVFSSGVAAITAVVSSLKSGDLVLAEENVYGCTFRLFDRVFKKFGVTVEYLDFSQVSQFEQIRVKKPRLVWLESPTNPLLKVIDIRRAAEICRTIGSTLLVDNTFASGYVQQPLALGADLSLSSTTKYINGHSDCLGGVVCTNSEEWAENMVFAQKALGLNPSPFDSWLISRGVKTLALRMQQHQRNAQALAEWLEALPGIGWVRYPGLPSHPDHELAKRQMRNGGSGIVVADFGLTLEKTRDLLQGLRYFKLAESLGGVESLVCHPATMTHASVPREVREQVGITDAVVRFSVGVEEIGDLLEDLQDGFRRVGCYARSYQLT